MKRSNVLGLFTLFALELLAINILRLPEMLRFESFAFCDRGTNLTLQYLISHGSRPTIDFGYAYGLLSVLIGRLWFSIFGLTPWAYQLAMIACNLLFAWALAKILHHLKIGAVGFTLAIVAVGFAYQASYPNLAQALEAVLLTFALALQAGGSLAGALTLASAAVFVKPSMGYLYSLLLVFLIARDLVARGSGVRKWVDTFAPMVVSCALLAIVLATVYGWRPLLRTVLPFEGFTNYRASNFGFFHGSGRGLWLPAHARWEIYVVDIAGFWIVGTIALIFFAVAAAFQIGRGASQSGELRRNDQVILTCAILHVAFVSLFFGNQLSWIYYSYFLIIGVALALDATRYRRLFGAALCTLAFFAWTDVVFWTNQWWRSTAPSSATARLWAPQDVASEWGNVLALVSGKKPVMLDTNGAAELMFPEFEEPVTVYLDPGLVKAPEIRRKVSQLSVARVVVTLTRPAVCGTQPTVAEFASALKQFDPLWRGQYFGVFQRRVVSSPAVQDHLPAAAMLDNRLRCAGL